MVLQQAAHDLETIRSLARPTFRYEEMKHPSIIIEFRMFCIFRKQAYVPSS